MTSRCFTAVKTLTTSVITSVTPSEKEESHNLENTSASRVEERIPKEKSSSHQLLSEDPSKMIMVTHAWLFWKSPTRHTLRLPNFSALLLPLLKSLVPIGITSSSGDSTLPSVL